MMTPSPLMASRFAFSQMEWLSGLPFYTIYERIVCSADYVLRRQDAYLNIIINNPLFKDIILNKEAIKRVTLELRARYEKGEPPKGLTDNERLMADNFSDIFDEWKPIVRCMRFIEAYDESPDVASINRFIKDAPPESLQMAKDLYEQGGVDALWSFLFNKEWGVRNSGYDPRSVLAGQEQNLIKRFDSYNRSMGTRWFLKDEISSLAKYYKLTSKKWKNASQVQDYLKGFIKELLGFPLIPFPSGDLYEGK